MADEIHYRPATIEDIRPAYAVFRRSLFDYLFRQSFIDETTAKEPPIESDWRRQSAWIEHLWGSAAENWVAQDAAGRIVGWAMSIERDGHLELTHFFVEPGVQAKGIGRSLIQRAFPNGRAHHKAILASQDPRALSLYVRSGVNYVTTSVDFIIASRQIEPATDLRFERVGSDGAAVEAITALEQEVLGYRREPDVRFLLSIRPAWLALRAGSVVGFAFGPHPKQQASRVQPNGSGPMAALNADDLPAILDHVIGAVQAASAGKFSITVPLINRVAVAHLLGRGGRIDPFYMKILASDDSMRLDRWILTNPAFIM
ncbi:MAG TPA: GNAT family N-acetyltransferase [Alphaproteobacteria bacterium]|nr:GNAT family N-acetyltransferase [Alphaproteobacteria bacterium]